MAQESLGTVTKRRLLGVLFLVVLAGLITLSIAIYNKAFTATVDVTLKADHTGNELMVDSDVKERGIIVGSVKSVHATGEGGATVTLALDPSRVDEIPANVTAQILPKTLFGEQYVSLNFPQNPSQHIQAGDVIPQDRSKGALETEKVLGDILPVLTAVDPADLNATLTALAQALQNRGDKVGQTLVNFDQYLTKINPQTAQLADDISKLGQVSLEYNSLAPDIFGTLQNLQTSAQTVIQRRAALDNLLVGANDASNVLNGFLSDNEQRLIQVTGQTDKVYALLDEYSPEFTCLFAGLAHLYDLGSSAVYDHRIHLTAQVDLTNLGPYVKNSKKDDTPILVTGYGPHCFGLPNNPTPTDAHGRFQIPEQFQCLRDGVNGGALTARGENPNCKTNTASDTTSALNSPEENALVNALIAGDLHTTPNKVPGAATLLAGPLLRGTQVVVK